MKNCLLVRFLIRFRVRFFYLASFLSRLDAIARDAELEEKSMEELSRLASILHNGCLKAVGEYEDKLKEDPNFDGEQINSLMDYK